MVANYDICQMKVQMQLEHTNLAINNYYLHDTINGHGVNMARPYIC